MSEVKFNLTDAQQSIHGTIPVSIADAAVAALSAEPETIVEFKAALARYIKPITSVGPLASFHKSADIDKEPCAAGMITIDLAARIIVSDSTYSQPEPQGRVNYHDGTRVTDVPLLYCLPDDWLFLKSINEYECLRERRRQERAARSSLDERAILYGRPLLEFISRECLALNYSPAQPTSSMTQPVRIAVPGGCQANAEEAKQDEMKDAIVKEISALHARWLMTPLDDLRGQSPRDVLLAKQDFIDYDLHTRELQWSLQHEGPPCLASDSFAYCFAGFGTHEWVAYYDLVRHLLWSTLSYQASRPDCVAGDHARRFGGDMSSQTEFEEELAQLEEFKTNWLEEPQRDYEGRIPALIIENERKRLPLALRGRDMVIDEDCPVCQLMSDETALGLEVGFWHLDGSHMDDDFAFSSFPTREEWKADRRRWEEFNEKFDREWEERQHRLARGEPVDCEADLIGPDLFDCNLIDRNSSGAEDESSDLLQ